MSVPAFGIADQRRNDRFCRPGGFRSAALVSAPSSRKVEHLAARVPQGAARFLVAGGLASLLNWLVRFPLSALVPFGMAMGLAYGAGMVVGFVLYRTWVFPGSPVPLGEQVMRFLGVNALGLAAVIAVAKALVVAIGWLAVLRAPLGQATAHAVAILFGAAVNFAGHRALTFSRRAVSGREPLRATG